MLSVNVTAELQNGVLLDNPHFLQSPFWAEFKSHHGWKNYRFYIELKDSDCFQDGVYPVSVLVRSFKKLFSHNALLSFGRLTNLHFIFIYLKFMNNYCVGQGSNVV